MALKTVKSDRKFILNVLSESQYFIKVFYFNVINVYVLTAALQTFLADL